MNSHWNSYELHMKFQWDHIEITLKFIRSSYEVLVNSHWSSFELYMKFQWNQNEFTKNSQWINNEFTLKFIWTSYEILMKSQWIHTEVHMKFTMNSNLLVNLLINVSWKYIFVTFYVFHCVKRPQIMLFRSSHKVYVEHMFYDKEKVTDYLKK